MLTKKNKRKFLFAGVFMVSICICFSITSLYVYNKGKMEYAQMQQTVLVNGNKVNNVITKLLYKTQVLAALVVQNDGGIEDFEKVAATLVDDPAIKNVLIAPDGVVSKVYPMEKNEAVLGRNFFEKGDGNVEAIQAPNTSWPVLRA